MRSFSTYFIQCLLFVFLVKNSVAQQNDTVKVPKSKGIPPIEISNSSMSLSTDDVKSVDFDTTYYKKYSDRLVIGIFQSYRDYDLAFKQLSIADSGKGKLDYIAQANTVSGVNISYDKFSLSLGFKSAITPDDLAKKGRTTYKNIGLNIGGNKWILETAYRSYKGFYDKNTSNYDTSFARTGVYYQNPGMLNQSFKAKFMHFTNNKKYSYKSAYEASYHQLKSAFTWVFVGNVFYNNLRTDSSFIPPLARKYYGSRDMLNKINVFGISAGAGASFNLVIWKRIFINGLLVGGVEPQWRTYGYNTGANEKLMYISFSGDFRGSLGYNGKNFYILVSTINDYSLINSSGLGLTNKFVSGAFTYGYRFKFRTREAYKKFQQTKVYKLF